MVNCCPVVELRQYTLHPGTRDTLIDLFERDFIESQEALGMRLIGQFRDVDNPNRFVWLRGFDDMPSRGPALAGFYGGPIWQSHRDAANATMVDSDDVLLLRPARPGSGFSLDGLKRGAAGSLDRKADLIIATICSFDEPVSDEFLEFFERQVKAEIQRDGARVTGVFLERTQSEQLSCAAGTRRRERPRLVYAPNARSRRLFRKRETALAPGHSTRSLVGDAPVPGALASLRLRPVKFLAYDSIPNLLIGNSAGGDS